MKIIAERAALLKNLAALNRVVEKRTTIPILSSVLLDAAGEALNLKASDLDIEMTGRIHCQVETAGAITVQAHLLHDIVRKLPDGAQVAIEATDGGGRVAVKAGRSRFTLQALPASDFPDLAAGEFPHSFTLPGVALAKMIARTSFAISTEETRFYLNGIYLHVQGGHLYAVATDGHRLARAHVDGPSGLEGMDGMPGVIVPRKTVAELARLAEEAGKDDVRIDLSPHKIRAAFGDTVLTSKLIDGTFPDYQRVIPRGNDKVATVEITALKAAIDRVSSVSTERGRAVKLAFDDGRLTLTVENPDAGTATDEIEVDYDAEALSIGFNARYALDIAGALGTDTAVIRLADNGSPTIFQPTADDSLLCVLMPMRV
ncbi:DNA polymerase III subunit beta [Microvirga arsenatis]|uniref:Beta sliding clamp n=1 Tax=Microvirga arsenatis TaxID=2692265 RepID=A0ABW9Z1G6_9HYPH|nr:DNA polymerase III subunit beta [Microvirga arsenatis]NBJ13234.1 DNA polymerase III subunit beta [Microvirga arsenatis]NBJ25128.1 DNA polymerase III subunit beta [Microvirga arsenatis]